MKKRIISMMLVAAMAFGLAACGSSSDSGSGSGSTGGSSGSASTTADNMLYLQIASEPAYLDPALNSSVDGGILAVNSFAGLYTFNEDGEIIPDLADGMPEVSEDGTEYTIKMIESKWSNGDDLNANDFVYSWNRVVAEETAADYAYLFDVIETSDDGTLAVEAEDDYTLKITLKNPTPYFMDLLAFPTFLPVHQASVEGAEGSEPGAWAQEAGFVSNGAYILSEWNHNENMVYVKNPEYHDAENVTMDELHFMLSADDTAIYAAYNSGDVDYIDTVPTDEVSSILGNDDVYIAPQLGTYYALFNVDDPIFEGKTVEEAATMRKAMNLLIDRGFIVENVGQTGQVIADSFVPADMADGNGGVFKSGDNSSYYDGEETGASKVEEAKEMLESVGYEFTDKGDGTYSCSPEINMTYLTNEGTGHTAIAQAIQQDFETLGISMKIESQEWNVFLENRKNGDFTIARNGWVADYNDPINMLEIFTSDSGNNDAQLGKSTSSAAPDWTAYDELISSIRTEADFEARVDLLHEAEDMLMDTGCVMPIYYYNDIYLQKTNIDHIYNNLYGMKYFMHATKS